DLDFQTYRLSYMQGDRVIALLKALGYATVEFAAAQGESLAETVYTVLQEFESYPLVIKLIDANKTSLMEPALDGGGGEASGLGGTYLHQQTSGAPEHRLFIVYEKAYPEQMHALMQLLRNDIDVPARQVVIEALVVEVDTDKLDELGVNYALQREEFNLTADVNQAGLLPFVGQFDDHWKNDWKGFSAGLRALTQTVHAEILSNPSVLVLNGRQARIQVGQQVPTSTAVATNTHVRSGVTYLQTGIVLNLRPRISEDGSEVTMQIETIVSSVNPTKREHTTETSVLLAPVVDNRQVQTFVRVADNTPFIVGGLIAANKSNSNSGVPFLSKIPYLGNLFKRSSKKNDKREVIVVLTPHVIDTSEKSFSYVIPKDSETFDSFDHILFRNAYRIRDDDVFDLTFATKSNYYNSILGELKTFHDTHFEIFEKEPVFDYLHDKVPGEEVIVRRMIWEIVHKAKYHHYINDDHILVFEANEGAAFGNKFKTLFLGKLLRDLNSADENSLVLDYADHKAKTTGPFEHPRALISHTNIANPANYVEQISALNSDDLERNTVLLSNAVSPPGVRGATALEVLKGVLVLKRILALNHSMPVTINEFRVGRQIIFPTEQELRDKYHIIDYDVARFFYQVINYYPEFESAFNRDSDAILERIKELSEAGAQ
ncbi:MAG: type II secretion system protein GspD, partial [Verrucomicrobia bacterium]|nr:type II secretion system protein GspD [Verrucomicrobiota bacterium]